MTLRKEGKEGRRLEKLASVVLFYFIFVFVKKKVSHNDLRIKVCNVLNLYLFHKSQSWHSSIWGSEEQGWGIVHDGDGTKRKLFRLKCGRGVCLFYFEICFGVAYDNREKKLIEEGGQVFITITHFETCYFNRKCVCNTICRMIMETIFFRYFVSNPKYYVRAILESFEI